MVKTARAPTDRHSMPYGEGVEAGSRPVALAVMPSPLSRRSCSRAAKRYGATPRPCARADPGLPEPLRPLLPRPAGAGTAGGVARR